MLRQLPTRRTHRSTPCPTHAHSVFPFGWSFLACSSTFWPVSDRTRLLWAFQDLPKLLHIQATLRSGPCWCSNTGSRSPSFFSPHEYQPSHRHTIDSLITDSPQFAPWGIGYQGVSGLQEIRYRGQKHNYVSMMSTVLLNSVACSSMREIWSKSSILHALHLLHTVMPV